MLCSIFRVFFGLIAAWLVAGLAQVLFVITPADLVAVGASQMGERLQGAGLLTLLAATQTAVFSAPFALLLVGYGEWLGWRLWLYYVLGGLAIAAAGFFALHIGESSSGTILNDYALRAFLITGVVAGLVYWAVAGRWAGGNAARAAAPASERRAEAP